MVAGNCKNTLGSSNVCTLTDSDNCIFIGNNTAALNITVDKLNRAGFFLVILRYPIPFVNSQCMTVQVNSNIGIVAKIHIVVVGIVAGIGCIVFQKSDSITVICPEYSIKKVIVITSSVDCDNIRHRNCPAVIRCYRFLFCIDNKSSIKCLCYGLERYHAETKRCYKACDKYTFQQAFRFFFHKKCPPLKKYFMYFKL